MKAMLWWRCALVLWAVVVAQQEQPIDPDGQQQQNIQQRPTRGGVPDILLENALDFTWWTSVGQQFNLHVCDMELFDNEFAFQWPDTAARSRDRGDHHYGIKGNLTAEKLHDILHEYGYLQLRAHELPEWQVNYANMRRLMDWLHQNELPSVFAFMFDEFWLVFMRLHNLIGAVIGDYWRLTDMWAWRVDAGTRDQGWGIHRDFPKFSHHTDGRLKSLSVWLPLGEVTTHHSCMHVVPKDVDPEYYGSGEIPDDAALMRAMPSIVALPAAEGDALMWDQRLLHYGGAASPRSPTPRYSVSIEFEQVGGERDARGSSPVKLPSNYERIMRISSLLDRYAHMYIDLEDPDQATELSEWRNFILRMRQTDDRIGELGELMGERGREHYWNTTSVLEALMETS